MQLFGRFLVAHLGKPFRLFVRVDSAFGAPYHRAASHPVVHLDGLEGRGVAFFVDGSAPFDNGTSRALVVNE